MDRKCAYYSKNAKRLIEQVNEGCQPECSGRHLQAYQRAAHSTSTYNVTKQRSPVKTQKQGSPHNIDKVTNHYKSKSPDRSRPSNPEYVTKPRIPVNVIGHRGGKHMLTPRENFFETGLPEDNYKSRSPMNISGHGAYKHISGPRNRDDMSKSTSKNNSDKCCQTSSKMYFIQIAKSASPRREVGLNTPEFGISQHLPRPGNNGTKPYLKDVSKSPQGMPETGSSHHYLNTESPRHSPRSGSPNHLRRRSPQKLYTPKSRENIYVQCSREKLRRCYEKLWPEDECSRKYSPRSGRRQPPETESSDHTRTASPQMINRPTSPETIEDKSMKQEGRDYEVGRQISQTNLHGDSEKQYTTASHEDNNRGQYTLETGQPQHMGRNCGFNGPCHREICTSGKLDRTCRTSNREELQKSGYPDRGPRTGSPQNVAGDYGGQGGDAAQTLIHDHNAGDECSCPVANKLEKLKEEKQRKKGEGDSLWAQWKRMTQRKPKELDNLQRVLRRLGQMRAYHWLLVCAAAPLAFMWAYVLYAQMFVLATPDHFCATKALQEAEAIAKDVEFRRKWSIPKVGGEFDKCYKIDHDYKKIAKKTDKTTIENLLKNDGNLSDIPCDQGWEFVYDGISYSTISSDEQLVCANSYKKAFAHSFFFVGAFFGSLAFGVLGDEFGRLPALVASNLVVVLGSLASAAASNVWYFGLARLFAGIGYDTCFMAIYILVLEYVGPHYRAFVVNVLLGLFFGLGGLLLPSIASLVADWKNFLYATSAPMLMVLVFPIFLPESLRWLLLRGKLTRALRIIAKMQKAAKHEVSQKDLDNLIYEVVNHPASGNIRDAMSSPHISGMVSIFAAQYFVVMMLFETLVLLTEHTGMGFFAAFRISAAMELPAGLVVALLVNKGGRRLFTRVPMLIAGILTLFAAGAAKGTGLTTVAAAARFAAATARNTLYLWAAEAMPTGARAAGSAIAHAGGHLGCTLAPLFAHQVGNNDQSWPLIFMGLLTLLAAMFVCVLPETMHKSLPQKISVSKKRFKQSYRSFRKRLTWQGILETARLRKKKQHKERDQYTQPLTHHPSPHTAEHPFPHAAYGDFPSPPRDPLRHAMPRQWRTSDGII